LGWGAWRASADHSISISGAAVFDGRRVFDKNAREAARARRAIWFMTFIASMISSV